MNEKAICSKCVLTSDYKFIDLDNKNECKFCRNFVPKQVCGIEKLVEDVDLANGEKLGVTVSGGKDSIFMWGILTELFGKESVVALSYYRDGLTHPMAIENVKKAQKILGTKLVIVEDKHSLHRFKKAFSILIKNPKAEMTRVLLCVGCRYGITENLYKEGEKLGIKKYVSGASYLELAPFKEELLEDCSADGHIDCGLENMLKEYSQIDEDMKTLIWRDQKFKYKNNETLQNNIFEPGYKYTLYDFDNYVENNPEEIEKAVREKYGWTCSERNWHFDCIIEEFKDVFYYGLLGYTELDFKLSAMVRYNLISRDKAKIRIEENNEKIKTSFDNMKTMLTNLGLEEYSEDLKNFYKTSKYLEYREGN